MERAHQRASAELSAGLASSHTYSVFVLFPETEKPARDHAELASSHTCFCLFMCSCLVSSG